MARKRQRNAVGHAGKDVRLEHEEEDGIGAPNLRQRARQVVDAAEAPVPERMRELIAKAGEPELSPVAAEFQHVIFQDRNARI